MSASDVAIWLEIAAPFVAVAVALWRYERRLTQRLDAQDHNIKKLDDTLTRQFGTNGFVLKNEVRGLRADLNNERERFDAHLTDHADRGY